MRHTPFGMGDCAYSTGFNLRDTEGTFSALSYHVMNAFSNFVVEDSGRLEHQTVSVGLWLSNFPTALCAFYVFFGTSETKTHQQSLTFHKRILKNLLSKTEISQVCVCVCVCVCSIHIFPYKYPNISQTYSILHTYLPMKMEQTVPKRRHINFRRRGITQKKAYNIQNTAKV
jgi:hypothetical protein